MRKLTFILLWSAIFGLFLTGGAVAQKNGAAKKKKTKKTLTVTKAEPVLSVSMDSGSYKREPYLSLEPCAKETAEQISEMENAPDKNLQIEILLKRIDEKDEWVRACAIYRLGEFRKEARDALPVIIKLLRDEANQDVWRHVEEALWKIPPSADISLSERIRMSKSENVYLRIYGIYSLGYFKPVAASFEAKETLKTLIEAVTDEDITASWMAVMGIRQLGFYGVDTSDAIPVLSEAIKTGKMSPLHPVRALVPMGEKALPAAPLLFDIPKFLRVKNMRAAGMKIMCAPTAFT